VQNTKTKGRKEEPKEKEEMKKRKNEKK